MDRKEHALVLYSPMFASIFFLSRGSLIYKTVEVDRFKNYGTNHIYRKLHVMIKSTEWIKPDYYLNKYFLTTQGMKIVRVRIH